MFWWAVLGYVLLSPVLGLAIGTAIRLQDDAPRSSRQETSPGVEACSARRPAASAHAPALRARAS
jgi:hypothetical protein